MKKLFIIGLLCFVLLFGCTSSQTDQNPAQKPADTKPVDTTKPVNTTSNTENTKPKETIPTFSTKDSVTNLFNLGMTASWKVSYELTSGTQSYQMVQYKRGETDMRTDISMQGSESRVYLLSDLSYTCSKQGETWTCYSLTGFTSEDTLAKTAAALPHFTTTELPNMQLAGIDAKCYNLKDADGVELDYCFSPEGVPLYIKTGATEQIPEVVVVRAISYSTQVTDSDFQLPAEPQNMEGLY
jgi:hypothetical protein